MNTKPTNPEKTALDIQVGGEHYKGKAIQPVEYIHANKIGFMEGNVIKYVTRWKDKNGIADLQKAKHYIELLIELESRSQPQRVFVATTGPAYATPAR
jgi:hypothetical protein